MLRPSYSDLMEVLEKQENIDSNIASRYTIVIAAARRARMLIDNSESYIKGDRDKAVSFAVDEMYAGHLKMNEGQKNVPNPEAVLVEETFVNDAAN